MSAKLHENHQREDAHGPVRDVTWEYGPLTVCRWCHEEVQIRKARAGHRYRLNLDGTLHSETCANPWTPRERSRERESPNMPESLDDMRARARR